MKDALPVEPHFLSLLFTDRAHPPPHPRPIARVKAAHAISGACSNVTLALNTPSFAKVHGLKVIARVGDRHRTDRIIDFFIEIKNIGRGEFV